jgi:hypothetical protein
MAFDDLFVRTAPGALEAEKLVPTGLQGAFQISVPIKARPIRLAFVNAVMKLLWKSQRRRNRVLAKQEWRNQCRQTSRPFRPAVPKK